MVRDILAGAIRVLKRHGGRHFTTIRVAEEAGISVGSLYQYFPNKDSILFEIQRQEWEATSAGIVEILGDRRFAPPARLRRLVRAFFESEFAEADLRKAVAETGLVMEETVEFRQIAEKIYSAMEAFLTELLPRTSPVRRRFLGRFLFMILQSLAEKVTSEPPPNADLNAWAETCGEMLAAYLRV
jgi:AcrR family transcriptional regulator